MEVRLLRHWAVISLLAWFCAGCSATPGVKDVAPDARVALMKAPPGTIDLKAVSDGVRLFGVSEDAPGPAGGMVGVSLAFGDFNGDGNDDLAIGSPALPGLHAEGEAPSGPGGVYRIFGRTSLPTLNELPTLSDVVLVAETASAGYAVEFGDLNGDGLEDLVIGAPWGAGFMPFRKDREGVVAVIFGRRDLAGTHKIGQVADVLLSGAHTNDFAGAALGTGDFNGDGLEDLLIGAPLDIALGTFERGNAGAAYLVLGRRQWPKTLDLAREASATFFGVDSGDRTGTAVALSDVTGDGLADVIVGAPLANWFVDVEQNKKDSGAVYILKGREELPEKIDLASEADTKIYGTEEGDGAGWSLATGDFNGDGTADLVIGAPLARHSNVRRNEDLYDLIGGNTRSDLGLAVTRSRVAGHAEGEVYLLWGKPNWPAEISLANGAAATLYGPPFDIGEEVWLLPKGGGDTGYSIAMGDVDGDGRHDLIVGTPFGDGSGPMEKDVGLVHLVLGTDRLRGTAGLAKYSSHQVVGSKENYRLGAAVAAGDFDGDGRDEIAVAEPRASGLDREETVIGRVYLIERLPASAKDEGPKFKKRALHKPATP